jgi:predicted dehydrogenase
MLAEELAEFGRCIRGEAEPETGAEAGIAALAVVLEALERHAASPGEKRVVATGQSA